MSIRRSLGIGAGLGAAWLLWRGRPGPSLSGQVAVITGGSRGLGLALARQLGAIGVKLALVARDEDELRRAAEELKQQGYEVSTWPCDVTKHGSAKALMEVIVARHGGIDLLINNAGQITVGPFELFSEDDFEKALAIHLMAPLAMVRASLPYLRERAGRIVNIASIGGKLGVPHLSPYCASKFALVGLSKTLRAELAPQGISVTTVCPGLMRTGSHWNASFKGQRENEFAWFAHGASLPGVSMGAERAAGQIVRALRRRDAELVISLQANAAVLAEAVAPGLVAAISGVVAGLLPAAPEHGGRKPKKGWEAASRWAPSFFTQLGDRAAVENNELGGNASPK